MGFHGPRSNAKSADPWSGSGREYGEMAIGVFTLGNGGSSSRDGLMWLIHFISDTLITLITANH